MTLANFFLLIYSSIDRLGLFCDFFTIFVSIVQGKDVKITTNPFLFYWYAKTIMNKLKHTYMNPRLQLLVHFRQKQITSPLKK